MEKQKLEMGSYGLAEPFDSYQGLWKSCGLEIFSEETLGSYQGDIVAVLFDPQTGLYAYGHTGYGSCSGCDVYCAASSLSDYEEIRDGITKGLIWLPRQEMLDFLDKHDWKGEYFSDGADLMRWIQYTKAKLTA